MTPRLRLRATDREDMATIATILQDAIVPVSEIAYVPAERQFVAVVQRFRWEQAGELVDGKPVYERINCGLVFKQVEAVKQRGIDPRVDPGAKDGMLELLTIQVEPGAAVLLFAGAAAIRLDLAAIDCHIEDIGEPWPTPRKPGHEAAEATGA